MNHLSTADAPLWPLDVHYPLIGPGNQTTTISVGPGISALVGPNGSGKTRALRAIATALTANGRIQIDDRKVHFLSAGRSSPFEGFRAKAERPDWYTDADAAIGHADYVRRWWEYESVTGDLLVLDARPDLQLKVEARLQQLFDRSVQLRWTQQGLAVRIVSVIGGDSYAANHEASGILQLVALLSAIHNDEIGALLIDEPEISLHPQHQAFLLEEMQQVAGNPRDRKKKLIVIATHSATMLPLRRINDLPKIAFFTSVRRPPAQMSPDAPILQRRRLAALVARLGMTHRMAMFAEHVLLVEGPSDEIVCSQLARRLGLRLLARNAQILPVTGKGEFVEAAKLFRTIDKRVSILADLDALSDDSLLVRYFSELPEAVRVANGLGRNAVAELDRDLRDDLAAFMRRFASAEGAAADALLDPRDEDLSSLAGRRATLCRVLTDPASFGGDAAVEASGLRVRYETLLAALAGLGCFFLRRGAIEDYYDAGSADNGGKPERSAAEAATFEDIAVEPLVDRYGDVLAALRHAAPNQSVDDDLLLRMKLGAVLTPVLLAMNVDSSDAMLAEVARNVIGPDAELFTLVNRSTRQGVRVEVDIASPLFERTTFPFVIGLSDNPTEVVPFVLPGVPRDT